ncbi:hypothetical protein ONV78_11455 [Hahella sp. CR1]|uniref:hypothetical protein n=1 Tax=Hahella sp. CR1 TaxID=2992807 RepID=UPI0024412FB4|nr:hypothetical protein [Hahella sp. CR1]MDG9668351.1 hypothetical protein [Hahella sp. CR1]
MTILMRNVGKSAPQSVSPCFAMVGQHDICQRRDLAACFSRINRQLAGKLRVCPDLVSAAW